RYGTLTVIAWVFGWAALLFAPIGGVALAAGAPSWSAGAWAYAGFIVLVPTVLAYSLSAWALRRASAGLVVIYVYLQPVLVALLARIQLGQPLERRFLPAGVLIFAGVTIVATGAPRARTALSSDAP